MDTLDMCFQDVSQQKQMATGENFCHRTSLVNFFHPVFVKRLPEISLILMDIDLGKGMDGTEAAEKILESHELPIVFLTSHSEKEYVNRVKKITNYGYVLKNSGEFVLIEAIYMAFSLYEAHKELQNQK